MELEIENKVSLAKYTTLKVGGVADYFVEAKTVEEMKQALQFAKQIVAPVLIIGWGSNILVNDDGWRGLVIKNSIKGVSFRVENNEVCLTCGAGEMFDAVIEHSVDKGYWGLENLSSIPGTVGATPIQNVGAYGVEISSLITKVITVNTETLEEKEFAQSDCQFDYRDSFFKTREGRKWVIVEVEMKLSIAPQPKLDYESLQILKSEGDLNPALIRDKVQSIRADKFPDLNQIGTAGSFFKNPVIPNELFTKIKIEHPSLPGFPVDEKMTKVSLGYILDKICGLRGHCNNGVCLYEKQALVLVNKNTKEAKDIDDFANSVVEIVEQKTGIEVEREVRSV